MLLPIQMLEGGGGGGGNIVYYVELENIVNRSLYAFPSVGE